jgi:hypothetical protein
MLQHLIVLQSSDRSPKLKMTAVRGKNDSNHIIKAEGKDFRSAFSQAGCLAGQSPHGLN